MVLRGHDMCLNSISLVLFAKSVLVDDGAPLKDHQHAQAGVSDDGGVSAA